MLYIPYPFKCCARCREHIPFVAFPKNKNSADFLYSYCKICCAKYNGSHRREKKKCNTAYYASHKEQIAEHGKKYRANNHEVIVQRKVKYRADNKEKIAEHTRKYRAENPEKVKWLDHLSQARYYARHKNEQAEKGAKYRREHPDKTRASHILWARKNPDKRKQYGAKYCATHPEKVRIKSKLRRARKRSLPATFSVNDWMRALNYFHGACAYCGNGPSFFDRYFLLHEEHHIPQSPDYELAVSNPGYVATNIVPACQDCNLKKGNKNPEVWIMQRFDKKRGKAILERIHQYFEWVKSQS